LLLRDPAGFGFVTSSFCRVINRGNQARRLSLSPPIIGINPLKILVWLFLRARRGQRVRIHCGPPVTLRNLERTVWKTVFLGTQRHILRCIAWVPERYIETENRRLADVLVFTASILPRWFANQWLTDSLVVETNFYFL
jgi:hypothetical protein